MVLHFLEDGVISMVIVEFIKLKKPEKARLLCELAELHYQGGSRVYLTVQDENQAVTLDQFLWTYKKNSFLPHSCDTGAVDCLDDPIVIGTRDRNPNAARILVMGKPCSISFMKQFEKIYDFVELYDEELTRAARCRFAQYRELGFAPGMRGE